MNTQPAPGAFVEDHALRRIIELVRCERVLVLTGAGCSTESGIPDYRDTDGNWKRRQPVRYQDFARSEAVRRRYWARSLLGWPMLDGARPNHAHRALAQLEESGHIGFLITQNVDGLHRKAGSRNVLDLHGCMDDVLCLSCGATSPRSQFQERLLELNPQWQGPAAPHAPDGDADLEGMDFSSFRVPACVACSGVLKPAVVFFGENVPSARVRYAMERLHQSRALLVVGSSLMVWSGFRFVKAAKELGLPAAGINLGRTRADGLFDIKLSASCGEVLPRIAGSIGVSA